MAASASDACNVDDAVAVVFVHYPCVNGAGGLAEEALAVDLRQRLAFPDDAATMGT